MAGGLRAMGAHVSITDDERWLVRPHPLVGPAHVDVGLAGTVMRFVPPVAGLADGRVTFDGDPHARTRPLGPLIGALRSLGVRIDVAGDRQPAADRARHRPGRPAARWSSTPPPPASSSPGCCWPRPRFDRGVVVRHVGPPVPVRAAPADDRADAAGRRGGGRRQHPRRLGGRAGPARRPGLGDRTGPLRCGAVLRRRAGHRRRGDPAGLAAQQRPAGRAAPLAAAADGRRGDPRPPPG